MTEHGASGSIAASARALLTAGETAEAIELLTHHAQRSPGDAELGEMLVQVLLNTGRAAEAASWAERTAEAAPDEPASWRALGWALVRSGRQNEAIDAFRRLVRMRPELDATLSLLQLLRARGDHDQSFEVIGEALKAFPGHPSLMLALGSLLSDVGQSDESVAVLREGLERAPSEPALLQAIAMKLNYCSADARAIVDAHRAFGAAHESRFQRGPSDWAAPRDPHRRIRVGYMSPDFREHSVAYFIEPVIRFADRSRFDLFCYFTSPHPDSETERFRAMNVTWRDAAGVSGPSLAELIRSDQIDILVDLAGLTAYSRLGVLAMKPAPIQVTYLGYPATLGLSAVDYRIVDDLTDPPGAEEYSVEALCRLPRCFVAFTPPDRAPPVRRPTAGITFGSFNNLAKVSHATARLWAGVLNAVPGSRLILKSKGLGSHLAQESMRSQFSAAGLDPERLDLRPFESNKANHLAAYNSIDIALDTAPYGGTTTTCEALWMGVPVVTLRGRTHAGRVGASLLHAAGLDALVASTDADYVRVAADLAGDAPRRRALGAGLREQIRSSPLCDGRGLSAAVDAALSNMWSRWCAANP